MLNKWVWLGVDRIHLTVGIGDQSLYKFILGQLYFMVEKDTQCQLVPHGKITIKPEQYVTRLSYYPSKDRQIASITIGTTKMKHKYFTLSLFPSKFSANEFEVLREVVGLLLPDVSYANLYQTARVSYLELAVDSLSHAAHTFIPFRSRCNISNIHQDKAGMMGTTYLGSATSGMLCRVYDKRKQLLESNLQAPYQIQTRIEAVLRHTGLKPCELGEKMKNPFARIEIADLGLAQAASNESPWQKFLSNCLATGSAGALSQCSKYQRKQFLTKLRASAAPWWNASHVWQGFPNAIAEISP